MDIKGIKNNAINNLKSNYFNNIFVTFLITTVLGGQYIYSTDKARFANYDKIIPAIGIYKSMMKFFYHGKIYDYLIILAYVTVLICFILFIKNVLGIGKIRYFLEERRYKKTRIDKILFPFRVKRGIHLAYVLFFKTLFQSLWNLTIIGGFIKRYEYLFIPYVLAENPNISKKEAFRLSKELTKGTKLKLFKLDLSLILYFLLSIITIKISDILFFNSYYECIIAETYMQLRKEKYKELTDKTLLNDKLLDISKVKAEEYPVKKFSIKERREFLNADYNRIYSIQNLILIFFTFTFIGYVYEVLLGLIRNGDLVNKGMMHGPWLPIYGIGGVLILILLEKFRDKPWQLFLLAFVVCGIVEYIGSWILDFFLNIKYWNYDTFILNINGRICFEGLMVFGLGGVLFTYLLGPILDNLYNKIKPKTKNIICAILIAFFSIDYIASCIHPNQGNGITYFEKRD